MISPKTDSIEYPRILVYLAYFKVHPATLVSLIGYNWIASYTGPGDEGYQKFFQERWKDEKTFILIEQDIVVWPGALEAIWDCPRDICVYDFHLPNHRTRNLENEKVGLPIGCIKISQNAIQKMPNLWVEPVKWDVCDLRLTKGIVEANLPVHQHHPGVVNANEALLGFVEMEDK